MSYENTYSYIISYRQDATKRQTAGIKFTHRPKIRFFAPHGRLVASIHVKFGRTVENLSALSDRDVSDA